MPNYSDGVGLLAGLGRELFEIQSLWSKAVYCIHVEDLMVSNDGFLVWKYLLIVF